MRLLLDTNVLVAAFITDGLCTKLLHHVSKHHELFSSAELMEEFRSVLAQRFEYSSDDIGRAMEALTPVVTLVTPITLEKQTVRDADDDVVIATALAADCEYLVTGDKDLLVLKRYNDIRIVSPRSFAEISSLET